MERLRLPPSRACRICINRMSDVCLERCAPAGKFKDFRPDLTIPLEDMPKLTLEEFRALPGQMRADWIFAEHQAIRSKLDGSENRPIIYRKRSSRIFENLQKSTLPDDPEKGNTIYQSNPTSDSSQGNGSEKMA